MENTLILDDASNKMSDSVNQTNEEGEGSISSSNKKTGEEVKKEI